MNTQLTNSPKKIENYRCGFCYDRENGTHGEIKREWSWEWLQFIPVCRLHACADGMDAGPKQVSDQ